MYKVIKAFADLHDNCYEYVEGDEYPRKGVNASPERIAELASCKNRRGEVLIKKADVRKPRTKKVEA